MNTTKQIVKLKGVGDSLRVTYDSSCAYDQIENEVSNLFDKLKNLTLNARVILEAEDKEVNEQLNSKITNFLKKKYNVHVSLPPIEKKSDSCSSDSVKSGLTTRVRQRSVEKNWYNSRSESLILAGRVRSGQKVTAKKHLVILGDVNPGAQIEAGGNIIVMGNLAGIVAAGQPDDESCLVIALNFKPIQVQIAGVIAAGLPPSKEKVTELARIDNNSIIVEDYIKFNPFTKFGWPEVL